MRMQAARFPYGLVVGLIALCGALAFALVYHAVGASTSTSGSVQENAAQLQSACAADVSQWNWGRPAPADYETDLLSGDVPTVHLAPRVPQPANFWTVLNSCNAAPFLGTRVRFTAEVKAADVEGWAGLWMRVDSTSQALAFDNMHNRPIRGTLDWHVYSVVLDVSAQAHDIYVGLLLGGRGETWVRRPSFTVVTSDVPTTG
jgi:hypothetical protein